MKITDSQWQSFNINDVSHDQNYEVLFYRSIRGTCFLKPFLALSYPEWSISLRSKSFKCSICCSIVKHAIGKCKIISHIWTRDLIFEQNFNQWWSADLKYWLKGFRRNHSGPISRFWFCGEGSFKSDKRTKVGPKIKSLVQIWDIILHFLLYPGTQYMHYLCGSYIENLKDSFHSRHNNRVGRPSCASLQQKIRKPGIVESSVCCGFLWSINHAPKFRKCLK